ncbi:hypothetical protein [Nitrosomonas sp. Nm58]|uniref:hypothetical protein n=1 Tax=Nitrosomonas sp. Nm58 TaxID=200126 RepID=UPI00089CA75A|nr:hypothetical protein [Nitrosomonas sp. Nm58]SDY26296.1 hypothetical protein SAMN05421754_100512 [Nitrosomonas sp. Nm58]
MSPIKKLKYSKADEDVRRIFREKIAAYEAAGRMIVYIDESGFAHGVPHTRGCAPIGHRDVIARMTGMRKAVSTQLAP